MVGQPISVPLNNLSTEHGKTHMENDHVVDESLVCSFNETKTGDWRSRTPLPPTSATASAVAPTMAPAQRPTTATAGV